MKNPTIRLLCTAAAVALLLAAAAPALAGDTATGTYQVRLLRFSNGARAGTVTPASWPAAATDTELRAADGRPWVMETEPAGGLTACQWAELKARFIDWPSDATLRVDAHQRRPEWTAPRGADDACLAFITSSRNAGVRVRAVFRARDVIYSVGTPRLAWGSDTDAAAFKQIERHINFISNGFYFEGTPGYTALQRLGEKAAAFPIEDSGLGIATNENSNSTVTATPPTSETNTSAITPETTPETTSATPPETVPVATPPAAPATTPDPTPATPTTTTSETTQAATSIQVTAPAASQEAVAGNPESAAGESENPQRANQNIFVRNPKETELERAEKLKLKGKFEEAEAIYRVMLNKAPYDAHNGLGDIAARTGRYQEAIAEFQAAILLRPEAADPYNGLGSVSFFQQDYENAEKFFNLALTRRPADAVALTNLGWTALARGGMDTAQGFFDKALAAGPTSGASTGLYSGLARVALLRNDPARALEYADRILSAEPENPVGYAVRAQALLRKGDAAAAFDAAAIAAGLDPSRHAYFALQAAAAMAKGRFADAAAYYERTLAVCPADAPEAPAYYLSLAGAQQHSGDAAGAANTLQKAQRLYPKNADIRAALEKAGMVQPEKK